MELLTSHFIYVVNLRAQASHYISAAYCGSRDGSRFLITGGSDQRLRHWDLEHPEDSYILVHAPNDQLKYTPNALKYR
jgi:WD40 repeat protein